MFYQKHTSVAQENRDYYYYIIQVFLHNIRLKLSDMEVTVLQRNERHQVWLRYMTL